MDHPKKRITLGLVSAQDPRNIRSWSGTLHNMWKHLRQEYEVVEIVHRKPLWLKLYLKAKALITRIVTGKWYDQDHNFLSSRRFSKIAIRQGKEVDVFFAPVAATEIASLDVPQPIIYLSDTTYAQVEDYYHGFKNIAEFSKKQGREIESRALSNASHVVFSSDWAAQFAMQHYGLSEDKVSIIPFGSNLTTHGPAINERAKDATFHLLFIGVSWERKGGEIVMEALEELLQKGYDIHLTVCGCEPPRQHPQITVHPFLDKHDPEDLQTLEDLFRRSHLFLLPTRADCTPIVICEAAMYSLPVLTTDTGGVSSLIDQENSGWCLPEDADAGAYAEKITFLLEHEQERQRMAGRARQLFEDSLNWNRWLQEMDLIIQKLI